MLSLPFNFWWRRESEAWGVCAWYCGAVTAIIWRYVWPCPLEREKVKWDDWWEWRKADRAKALLLEVGKSVEGLFWGDAITLECLDYCTVLLRLCAGEQKCSKSKGDCNIRHQKPETRSSEPSRQSDPATRLITSVWKSWLQSFRLLNPSLCFQIHQDSARYTLHVKPAILTVGQMVGKVCDLQGDSRLLRDLAAQPALSSALVLDWAANFGKAETHRRYNGLPVLHLGLKSRTFNWINAYNQQFGGIFGSSKVQQFRFAALQITVC